MSGRSRTAQRSDAVDAAVRAGLVCYGLVHLLVALVAIRLALGDRSGSADSTGALRQLAQQPAGRLMVGAVAVGLGLLVLWRLLELWQVAREESGADRLRAGGGHVLKVVVYASLAYSAAQVATSDRGASEGGGRSTEETITARVLALPAGQVLVVLGALAIVGYGARLVWKGLSRDHADDLAAEGRTGEAGRAYLTLGMVGYVAKGAAIAVIGLLVGGAGLTRDADQSGGLDEALQEILQQPFGPVLLVAVGLGLAAYGAFCFARARHLSR